jgi:hypothetical protein
MAGMETITVEGESESRDFINLHWKIYAECSRWVPPLKKEVRRMLDTRRPLMSTLVRGSRLLRLLQGLPPGLARGFDAIRTAIPLRPRQSIQKASLMRVIVLLASVLIATAGAAHAQALSQSSDPFQRIFARLYNCDFAGANRLLDRQMEVDPENPLVYAVRGVAYLFSEMDRLNVLEADFFVDDDNMVDGQGQQQKPDPEVKQALFAALDQARTRARARLAADRNDRTALFAMCMASGVAADYTGFMERRQWKGIRLSRESNRYAQQLLRLDPPVYDAYMNVGCYEYVIGSLPFFVRWFVRFENIDGSKQKGVEAMKLVAQHGVYYGPFARILLAVAALRDGRQEDARTILEQLSLEYPENALLTREVVRITDRINTMTARRK